MRGRNNGGSGGGNNNNSNNNNSNNNNNRKGPNPLTRNYESNGPDVKIRGSAQQIAEKYSTLARDATSSGDRVMAENYLQHAEHYNRIIAAAQAQFAAQQVHPVRDDMDDDMDDNSYAFEGGPNHQSEPAQQQAPAQNYSPAPQMRSVDGSGPQPVIDGMPAEVALNSTQQGQPSGGRQHRERRPNRHQNANPVVDAPSGESLPADERSAEPPFPSVDFAPVENAAAPSSAEGEERQAPRRARRPRRDRSNENQAGDDSNEGGPQSPAPQADAGPSDEGGNQRPVMETVED